MPPSKPAELRREDLEEVMWRWIGGYVAIAVSLTGVAVAGPVAPNEVCIYEHVDFVGASRCFSLEPGMRHKLVPKLGGMNDRASSVHVGEDVSVVLYEHANFGGLSHRHDINRRDLGASGAGLKIGLQGRDAEKKDEVWPDFNDLVSSLIIVPKTMRVSGVELRRSLMGGMGSTENAFYPLPERLNESEARYPLLGWMNDKANYLNLYGDVEVTLYEHANFDGKPLKLPGVGDEKEHFILGKYQFDKRASSLVARWKGPQQHLAAEQVKVPQPSAPPPRDSFLINTGGTTHRAPVSMEPQTAKVLQTDSRLEMDTNRPGQDYRNFDLDVPEAKRCQRTCLDDPKCMAWTYVKPGVQGTKARCWLKSGVPPPKPSPCCISGVKTQ